MTETEFKTLAKQGYNRIPLILEAIADLDTPLSLYLKLTQNNQNGKNSFLLESVVGGERFGRYSIIGLPAQTILRASNMKTEIVQKEKVVESYDGNPLDFIAKYQSRFKVFIKPELPRFCGGLAGYFGYDTIRYIENRLEHSAPKDDLGFPDIQLLLTEELAVIDNVAGKIYLIVYADPTQPDAYTKGMDRLKTLNAMLNKTTIAPSMVGSGVTDIISDFPANDFKKAVVKTKEYITNGDCMQVVLARRIRKPYKDSPLSLYRSLRSLNPSPYLYYYHFNDLYIVGSSPEILVRQESAHEGRKIIIRPLAGTRKRGATPDEDERLAKELLADTKEIAEHVMLIDLARNDIGRIAKTGTVKMTEKMAIEKYSHVQHIVSNVEGLLKPGLTNLDVLKATFPAGTLSGAPKIRAMEIIDEMEPVKRGIYGGACGYLSFSGEMDLAIAIRTGLIYKKMLYIGVGCGIVADSNPESELQETENKARAVIRAAEIVQGGFYRQLYNS